MRHEKRLVRKGRLGAVHVTPDARVVDLSRTRRRGHGESTVRNGSSTDSAGSITETETGLRSLSMCTLILFELRVLALFHRYGARTSKSRMTTELSCLVGVVRCATDSAPTAAGEIAAGSADLSRRTENQVASLQPVAASVDERTAGLRCRKHGARARRPGAACGHADPRDRAGQLTRAVAAFRV